jgi:hypothetical protein
LSSAVSVASSAPRRPAQLGGGAQAQVGVALDHQQRTGPSPWICMTMEPLNFRLADSSAAAATISPSSFTALRVVVARLDLAPGVGNLDQLAAHGGVVEDEFLQGVLAGISRHFYPIFLSLP